jgi:hypothetical protein
MTENMNEMNEIKINALEEKELTLEECEKVAGGSPTRRRGKRKNSKKEPKENNTGSQASDDGSVSGSGSW